MSPPTQQRNARREAATFAYRFGAPLALAIAAITTLSEMVDALKPIVPESWKLPLTIGGIILGVLGRSTLRDAVEPNRRGTGRAARNRGTSGRFAPVDPDAPPKPPKEPKPKREPRKAAATRDESRPDIPNRPTAPLVRPPISEADADIIAAAMLRRMGHGAALLEARPPAAPVTPDSEA